MLFLGRAVAWFLGKGMVPALILAVLALGGHLLSAKRAELIERGKQKCENGWEIAIADQKRRVAEALAGATSAQLTAVELLNTELKTDADRIKADLEKYRIAAADSDGRCLSDSVRDLARGTEGEGRTDQSVPVAGQPKRRPASAKPPR